MSQFNTTEAASRDFVATHNLTFPNFYDPDAAVASAYGIRGVPSYVFIDSDGHIANRSTGARGVELLESMLNELRAE